MCNALLINLKNIIKDKSRSLNSKQKTYNLKTDTMLKH